MKINITIIIKVQNIFLKLKSIIFLYILLFVFSGISITLAAPYAQQLLNQQLILQQQQEQRRQQEQNQLQIDDAENVRRTRVGTDGVESIDDRSDGLCGNRNNRNDLLNNETYDKFKCKRDFRLIKVEGNKTFNIEELKKKFWVSI